jgi:hypothetical protein
VPFLNPMKTSPLRLAPAVPHVELAGLGWRRLSHRSILGRVAVQSSTSRAESFESCRIAWASVRECHPMGRADATIRASCLGVRQSLLVETVMSTRLPSRLMHCHASSSL